MSAYKHFVFPRLGGVDLMCWLVTFEGSRTNVPSHVLDVESIFYKSHMRAELSQETLAREVKAGKLI